MKYIVLLRGINISGKNKIVMSKLKLELENLGYKDVITYLNSGNVILLSNDSKEEIVSNIHLMIKEKFNLNIFVFAILVNELEDILSNHPVWWGTDNKEIYDNIIFIISPTTVEEVYKAIGPPKEGIDIVQSYKNVIFWSYNLKNYRKSSWWVKTVGGDIRNKITIRTSNTMRIVFELCNK